jgi:hypothetical protein
VPRAGANGKAGRRVDGHGRRGFSRRLHRAAPRTKTAEWSGAKRPCRWRASRYASSGTASPRPSPGRCWAISAPRW